MTAIAEKKNRALKAQLNKDLEIAKKIWNEGNWRFYNTCADYIFEKKLINRPHRKIVQLVTCAAKS